MKTKFRVFTALLLALMVLVSVLPLQAAAEIGQSGTVTRAEAENTAEAALSVKPMLTPSYTPSASYRSGKYYTQLCNVSLTGNQRTDLVNVARSQLGYHEGDNTSQLHGESSGSRNYTEYGYWYGTQVQGNSGGSYYAWCAYFISWCARQAGIPTSIISNASYACAGSDNGDFKNLDYYARGSYTPKVGDLVFFCWEGNSSCWDHVEIVIGVSSSEVTTLGGNTSTNNVKKRSWNLSNSYIRGYGVPKYTSGSTPTPTPTPSGSVQDLTNPKNPNKYSTPPSGTYLNVGDSGTYVRWLQACLNQCGYSCDVDGQFGYGTAEALKSFQRKYGLTVDGGFGPECRTKIIAVLTVATPNISVANVENGKKVTITSGNGATIFYTTNGSNPTESSTKYTGAFTLYGSATVKAVAMQNCRFNSGVKSTQVTIDRPGKPSINAVCVAQRVWIKWAPTANTHHYDVRIYPEGSQTEIICEYGVTNSYMAFELPAGKYYANVASCNQNGSVYTFSDSTSVFTVTNITDSSYQPAATVTSGGHRYVLYPDRMGSWQEAKEFCERQGGHLVTITSAAEQQTVQSLLQQYSSDASCWLGCKLMNDGSWMWVTGEAFDYTNWRTGEPNNSSNDEGYGMVVGDYNGQWNDVAMTTGSYNLCVVLELELTYHTVTFKDWNGTVLKTQQVEHGKAATAPANPTRTGYTFTGWDKAFNNVTADLVVTAQYSANTYTVTFKDWNGTVLKTQQVQYGGAATAPANPTRTGYTFTGWDKAFTNVTANLVVTAQYSINSYTVTFKDWNGTVLKTQQVQYGGAATAPANPTRAGYTFTGWDKAFTNVTANLVVTAQYSINTYTVTFKDWNGTVLKTQQVQYGGAATAPANPTRTGYTFTGWDKAFTNVTANLVVTAQYVQNEPVSTPVPSDAPQIVVESKTTSVGSTVAVNISIANNPGIVSMTLHVNFDSRLELVSVQDTGLLPGKVHSTVMLNPYTLAWENDSATQNYTVNGTLVTLTFNVPENLEEGDYAVSVSYDSEGYEIYDFNAEPVDFAVVNGKISVTDIIYGDVNGDGKVNNLDRLILTRYLANWPDYPASRIKPGADTNADGKINNLDRLILTRHLANWPDYATLPWSSGKSNASVVGAESGTKDNEPKIIVNGVEAAPGDTVSVGIEIANNPGIISMTLDVAFDPALTLLRVEDTGLLPGTVPCTVMQNPFTLVWTNDSASENFYVNGTLTYFVFKVADNAEPGAYNITVTYNLDEYDIYDCNAEPVEFAVQNGAVTVAAAQPEMHTVTFKDWDGTVLKTQEVQYGGNAEAPADPTRTGYTFTGWDKAFTNIMADLVVTAQYEINTYTVTFKDWDGTVLKTQEVQYGGDAEAPADPTRVGYTFTGWDKEFTNITADLVVTAQYEINTYTVTFKDWDGTVLKTQEVQYGGDAEAPADPTRVGYTFTGWDKEFTNITADLVVTAQYEINTYTVTFKDWDGTVLKTQEVQYGGDAEAPADPTRVGYTFTGWDKAFTNIMADLVVTAQYEINTYTVTFKDWDGTVLKTQEVQYGGDAEAPADPTRVGYTFTGWDKAFTNIMADLVVTAQYEINTYTVTFKDWDGTVLKTQEVQYGGDAEAPADPTRVGYTFTGWDKEFTNITADLVVTAQYEMLGDVDGDGNVSMADALTILRMAMDILPVENQHIVDVDGDGFITSMDALLALRFAMHIEQ